MSTVKMIFLISFFSIIWSCSAGIPSEKNKPDIQSYNAVTISVHDASVRLLEHDTLTSKPAVHIYSARNERESYQLFIYTPTGNKTIELLHTPFINGTGHTIPTGAVSCYEIGYVPVNTPSHRNEDGFRAGNYPDVLIPLAVNNAGTGFRGYSPLKSSLINGYWFDVYSAADTAPGEYSSSVTVMIDGVESAKATITLTVWNFTLPVVPALKTRFWNPEHQMRYAYGSLLQEDHDEAYWDTISDHVNVMLHEHRISGAMKSYSFYKDIGDLVSTQGVFTLTSEEKSYIQAFLQQNPSINTFEVPFPGYPTVSDLLGDGFYDMRTYNSASFTPDKIILLQNYMKSFDTELSDLLPEAIRIYTYISDEPSDEVSYNFTRDIGNAIQAAGLSRVNVLSAEQIQPDDLLSTEPFEALTEAVDIFCPVTGLLYFDLFGDKERELIDIQRNSGHDVWTYTALANIDKGPYWLTDYPLVNYRTAAWSAYNNNMNGLLYWSTAGWWAVDENGNSTFVDPWTSRTAYNNHDGLIYNGEGVLVYPSRPLGYDGCLPTIRLKAIRDSIDDYDYLTLASEVKTAEYIDDYNVLSNKLSNQ